MLLKEIPVSEWFHDDELQLEGQVVRHGEGGSVVRLRRPRPIIVHGETVGTVEMTKPQSYTPEWDVEPGRFKTR